MKFNLYKLKKKKSVRRSGESQDEMQTVTKYSTVMQMCDMPLLKGVKKNSTDYNNSWSQAMDRMLPVLTLLFPVLTLIFII